MIGRGGVPADADAVMLNVTAVGPDRAWVLDGVSVWDVATVGVERELRAW